MERCYALVRDGGRVSFWATDAEALAERTRGGGEIRPVLVDPGRDDYLSARAAAVRPVHVVQFGGERDADGRAVR